VFVDIVRCGRQPKPHSSTSGRLTEGRAADQLTVGWCSNRRQQAMASPVTIHLPTPFVLLTLRMLKFFVTVLRVIEECLCI
jgi:hypothetical protein